MGELIKQPETDALRVAITPGLSVQQILNEANVPASLSSLVVVTINGTELSQDQYPFLVPRQNDQIGIYVRPAGGDSGKQVLRLIATIVVAVIAFKVGGSALLASLGAKAGLSAATTQIVASAVIATVGALVINALIPPPSLNLPGSGYEQGESYFITGQRNQARPYQLVPVVYGRTKMVGNLANQPEIFSAGDSSLFTTLIDWGLGASQIIDVRAGDTRIGFFQGEQIIHENTPEYADPNNPGAGLAPVRLELVQYPLKDQELSIGLNRDTQEGIATTVPTAYSAVVELQFPQGIAYYDKQGNKQSLGVSFEGYYRKRGDENWLPWPDNTTGYTGANLRFSAGFIDPGTPNPNDPVSVEIVVPTFVESQSTFTVTLNFNQEVYSVGEEDIRIINAFDTTDKTDLFRLISVTEKESNRVFEYLYEAPPFQPNTSAQYFIATNMSSFRDAPFPDGISFPDAAYNSNNFTVRGEVTGPDPDPDPPTTPLYDRTVGNETYVVVIGSKLNSDFDGYVPGLTNFQIRGFEVWVKGVKQVTNTSNWKDYAGTYQDFVETQSFGSVTIEEFWSLKNAQGTTRFYPTIPNIDVNVFSSRFSLYGDDTKPARASIVIQFPVMGEYDIRVKRIGDTEFSNDKNQYFNACFWTRIGSRGFPFTDIDNGRRSVLNLQRKHTMMELRLEASENLQGNLQQISATVVSKLRGHNGTQWTEPSNSSNPAWIVADLLTGYRAQQLAYPSSVQDCPGYLDEIDLDLQSFREFARVCNEDVEYEYKGEPQTRKRYTCDVVLANSAPLMETIQNILGMARAALIVGQNGKIQIMMDEDRAGQVRQVFTPANSYDFSGTRTFPSLPHALKVEFVSPELGYQKGEAVVYAPGYDFNTATIFEEVKTFGCTNWHMAAQYGMYTLGQIYLRQEEFTLKVAAESLVVQRGDVCEISSEVAALGGASHLVVEHVSPDTFVLSEEPNKYDDPAYTFKTNEGVFQGSVRAIVGRTVQLDRTFATVNPADTNVIVIGQQGLVTKKYIIKSIRPLPDFSAELKLVPYDERMYRTDEGEFPEWEPGGDGDPQNPDNGGNARTENLQGFTYLEYDNRQPISVSKLTWELQTADAELSRWRILWTQGGGTGQIDVAVVPADRRSYEHKYAANGVEWGAGTYSVIPVMQLGYEAQGDTVFVGRSVDRISPPSPYDFRAVIEPGWEKFFWDRPDAPDIAGYTIYRLHDPNKIYDENDIIIGEAIATVPWDRQYYAVPKADQYYGPAHYWLICTDTSGNDSSWSYFDGLADGIPVPGLVEPFDFIAAGGVNGARLQWIDLDDPNELIDYYELRHADDELQQSINPSSYLGQVRPGVRRFELTSQGYSEVGSWFIRAVDKFGNAGPWNRTSSREIDYGLVGSYEQTMFYVDRMPWTEINVIYDIVGAEADKVNSIRSTLYPRQADARAQPIVIFETTDMSLRGFTYEIEQLPRGDIYHQGQIVVEGLVDGQMIGIYRATLDWQIEYDVIGPEAPTNLAYQRDDGTETLTITWTKPSDPDLDYYEIKYASRTDIEWEDAQSLGYRPWDAEIVTGIDDRPGKYFVRATDTSDNPGRIATLIVQSENGVDPNEGWELFQSIQGHFDWDGTLDNLYRPADGGTTLLLVEATPVIDGKQTAFFYYNEDTNIDPLAEIRIVDETLRAFEEDVEYGEMMSDWDLLSEVESLAFGKVLDSNVTLTHEVKIGEGDWQVFGDSVFTFSGDAKYRIRLENTLVGGKAGVDRSRILIYKRSEEP